MNLSLRLDNLRDAYRNGNITPRKLLLALREKAAALNPDYHLFIHLLSPEELEPFLTALEGADPESLPLYGVPFAIKDNIDLAGIPTTAACPAFAYVPKRSATVVEQLLALGAVPWGRPTSINSPPGSTAPAPPTAPVATACWRIIRRVARVPARRWRWPWV